MALTPTIVPILSAGRHRTARQGACFMEFASYLAGEKWSDHPACTHPVLASLARDVNDATSDSARGELLPLVHSVIGLSGDDRQLSAVLAMRGAALALPVVSMERQHVLAAGMLGIVMAHPQLESMATVALADAPHAERWARRYLADWPPRRAFGDRTAMAILHTAVVGIALACIDRPDALLKTLLSDAIDDAEVALRPAVAPRPANAPVRAG